jgi:cellulose synthase/poly-beta-1,6-N-acetylglucosamine synthase-like glycosyltransferase
MRFSIVIPTRNRPALLDRCLTAIHALDFPREDYEVLVVDDGSVPPIDHVVARHADALALRTFTGSGRGPAKARNLALRHANGDYVVFTDDDCQPDRNWLRAYDEAFRRTPTAGLGGSIVDSPENGLCGRASQMLVTFLYDYFDARHELNFFCSNNFAFPRRELQALGGFDESFPLAAAEDRDLCARWLRQAPLHFVPGAVIVHRQFLNFRTFFRQQFRYGRGAFQFWLRREQSGLSGNKLETWRFYKTMLTYPFGRERFVPAAILSLLLGISQFATALGYFEERSKFQAQPTLGSSPGTP